MPRKILIIDNDAEYVEAIATLCRGKGYEVLSALDGDKGFALARDSQPDVIILDVMMQYVSEGLDVAVKLRDDPVTARIPVILVTGIKKPQFLTLSFRPGEEWPNVKAMLEKPVKPEVLLSTIASALE